MFNFTKSFTCSPSMAVWLSGSLRKNCFTSPSANVTMVEANRAKLNIFELLEEGIKLEATVAERMMMVVVAVTFISHLFESSTPVSHFSLFTDHETNRNRHSI